MKNANEENKKEAASIFRTHHEKREVRKSYCDRKNRGEKKKRATTKYFYRKSKYLGDKASASEEKDADD